MTDKQAAEFVWPVRVYYEDTDAGGVVYYANYLCFMERARSEWLRALGYEQDRLVLEQQTIFAVRNISVDYLSPALFNEQLEVSVRPMELRRASITLAQAVKNHVGVEICRAQIRIACLNATSLRPKRMPNTLYSKLKCKLI